MKTKLMLITAISFACIAFNQSNKVAKVSNLIIKQNEVSQSHMMDTFEPIKDFEKVYFDEEKGLYQAK